MPNVIHAIVAILIFVYWILIIRKIMISRYAPVQTVKAKVVDKYKPDMVSKYHGTFQQERYIVVFDVNDKKLSFDVSEFSYGNYQIDQKGTLKYKGTKMISFQ